MIKEAILGISTLVTVVFSAPPSPLLSPLAQAKEVVLGERQLDLSKRHPDAQINDVFEFNILLFLENLDYGFTLEPGEFFAFHDQVLPELGDQALITGPSRFSSQESYQTTLGLSGNGVCHLASLINWAAGEAGLETVARVSHNFAPIPGVPRKYGVSIRTLPEATSNQNQNLYLKNTLDYPVKFVFNVEEEKVEIKVIKEIF